MDSLIALTLILIVFGLGDMIAVKTKSIVSMLFTASLLFLVAFWLGLPQTIFQDSLMLDLGGLIIVILLVHMGTLMNLEQLKQQWKTVLIALSAVIGIALCVPLLAGLVVGFEEALITAPPISGGVIASIIMGEAATELGMPNLALLAALIVVVQGFVGFPIASYFLKKEAQRVKEDYRAGHIVVESNEEKNAGESKKLLPDLPPALKSENVLLAKTALVALLAVLASSGIESLVGFDLLNANIAALLFGVLFSELGFLEQSVLSKANSFGFMMVPLTVVVLGSLADATPQALLETIIPILVTLFFGTLGVVVFSLVTAKVLHVSNYLAIGLGISAMVGFPGTFIISNEIAQTLGETEEEVQVIADRILPKMLVAGFVTVSIASVVLAGIFVPII